MPSFPGRVAALRQGQLSGELDSLQAKLGEQKVGLSSGHLDQGPRSGARVWAQATMSAEHSAALKRERDAALVEQEKAMKAMKDQLAALHAKEKAQVQEELDEGKPPTRPPPPLILFVLEWTG
jgi:hypothetical protein